MHGTPGAAGPAVAASCQRRMTPQQTASAVALITDSWQHEENLIMRARCT